MAKYLLQIGSFIFLYLGVVHLVYTFLTDKFSSRNLAVIEKMKASTPILTSETTMWRAWIGFNASHSIGAIFIGIMNIYLTHFHFEVFGPLLFGINLATVGIYLWLAKKYWFKIPFFGILITLICYLLAFIITVS